MERINYRPLFLSGIYTAIIFYLSKLAYSQKQRDWILERDNHTSQLRSYNEEDGWNNKGYCHEGGGCNHLHVHHIQPQRTGGEDSAQNGITLFECQHTGKCPSGKVKRELSLRNGKWVDDKKAFVVHPDMRDGMMNYKPDGDSIGEVFKQRNEAVEKGEKYWNDIHDEEMEQTARERSMQPGLVDFKQFPDVKRRKKKS